MVTIISDDFLPDMLLLINMQLLQEIILQVTSIQQNLAMKKHKKLNKYI
jgi:hypothetical protein